MPRRASRSLALMALASAAILPLTAGGAGAGCGVSTHEQTTSFTFPHQAETALSITTRNGAVIIRQGSGPAPSQVSIEARLVMTTQSRLEGTTISANRAPDGTLEVTAVPPDGRWLSREGCSFEILIPDTAAVAANTGNGRIDLSGLSGPARLRTSNGRITVTNHDGDVSAQTSNGAVRIVGTTGMIEVRTSNGAVTASPADDSPGPLDLRTSNGAIAIELPATFAGRFELSTSNGSIRIDDSLEARLHRSGRSAATISLGDGSMLSQARTSNGSISVDARPVRPASESAAAGGAADPGSAASTATR